MNLPEKFVQSMKEILKDDFENYLQSFDDIKYSGLRVNTSKISGEELDDKLTFDLTRVPWSKDGFYYDSNLQPSKHPFYFAGLYYIQEPSAMAPASILDIDKGDKVLDLCAAPGGKSTHLGAKLDNTGILVCNDISISRTKGLLKNIQLHGIKNSVVISEAPEKLVSHFKGYFDKIIVDAPCSGEGMFRKEPSMIKNWEKQEVEHYTDLQQNILKNASEMLCEGGLILYSTCTFSPKENEEIISSFLDNNKEYRLLPIDKSAGFSNGIQIDSDNTESYDLTNCARLWPHRIKGEGHFVALLKKQSTNDEAYNNIDTGYTEDYIDYNDKRIEAFKKFCDDNMNLKLDDNLFLKKDKLYVVPEGLPDLKGIRILRKGWLLGELKKNRFEPSQAFAMGLRREDVKRTINLSVDDINAVKYLKCETIRVEGQDGWNLVCVDNYPLGWGKLNKGVLKNKYNKDWRWM